MTWFFWSDTRLQYCKNIPKWFLRAAIVEDALKMSLVNYGALVVSHHESSAAIAEIWFRVKALFAAMTYFFHPNFFLSSWTIVDIFFSDVSSWIPGLRWPFWLDVFWFFKDSFLAEYVDMILTFNIVLWFLSGLPATSRDPFSCCSQPQALMVLHSLTSSCVKNSSITKWSEGPTENHHTILSSFQTLTKTEQWLCYKGLWNLAHLGCHVLTFVILNLTPES